MFNLINSYLRNNKLSSFSKPLKITTLKKKTQTSCIILFLFVIIIVYYFFTTQVNISSYNVLKMYSKNLIPA